MSVIQIQFRRDTAANWTSANPTLAAGEQGLDTTNLRLKMGDGSTAWTSLAYLSTRILSGSGAPAGGLGVDGDLYYDSTNTRLYGPKAAGAWGGGVSLIGPQGIQGIQGIQGNPGVSPNAFTTITGTTGTATADSASDSLQITGANGITTVAADNPEVVTISPTYGSSANQIAQGNDTRIVNAVQTSRTLTGTAPITIDGGTSADLSANRTIAIAAATTTTPGSLSAADKRIIDSLHYDAVADFGFVGNDSTLNDSAWTAAKAALPVGAVLFFPAGTYRVANEMTIDVDKRIQFKGAGRYTSIIKTTSATANIFNVSIPAWYNSWSDLGFQSTVTKTAGAAIALTSGSAIGSNVYRCWMTGIFRGIDANGSQSGNLSVWADLDISAIPNGGRGIKIQGDTINVMIHNATINAGAATTSACVEINQSGAVQVTGCDWIQGTNVLLINATAGAGPQACYFTNCFFDQPQGSVVKIMGTQTANRIKFTQCGIAPTGNNHGVEINGTGAGGVGTATALPAGISIVDCDIYCQVGTGTGAGVLVNGCQDVNIQNSRSTGFGGAGGAGIRVIPSASNQTKVRINGCIIGPNSNLTVTNTVGVEIQAGASALAALSVTDNLILGNGTAITDASAILATATKNINNNQGAAAGLTAQVTAGGTLTTTTETAVPGAQIYFPANSIKVGTTVQWTRVDTVSATSTTIEKARIGTAGTTGDATNISSTSVASGAAGSVFVEGSITFTSVGATAAFVGGISFVQAAAGNGAPTATVTGTVNTTVANFVTITTANGTANTRTYRGGTLTVISPA